MSHVIAVAGKGGVGKTTLCGLLIQYLCEQKKGPILAVDCLLYTSGYESKYLAEYFRWNSYNCSYQENGES